MYRIRIECVFKGSGFHVGHWEEFQNIKDLKDWVKDHELQCEVSFWMRLPEAELD